MAMPAVTPITVPRAGVVPAVSEMIRIPVLGAQRVELRFASLEDRDHFGNAWQTATLKPDPQAQAYYQVNLNTLGLADGTYEYETLIDGQPVPDPFAVEITKFGGYRSVFRIESKKRVAVEPFSWDDELAQNVTLPNNNQMVIYELPIRWMAVAADNSQVDLGTFEKAVFEHLDDLHSLGINAIELLPAQDSADTLNWGYGTRFFFAPDWDLGTPLEMKYFIKRCHQYGIRVILDVVMNHSRECPLERLAYDAYYLHDDEEPERNGWGGRRFRYRNQVNGEFAAREFQYRMAEFWIRQYHIDGFRIDEFSGINNWDFLQGFRERARAEHERLFPDRPFAVIAEDSARRPEITHSAAYNDQPVADSMWNFDFRDEVRRLLNNDVQTVLGQPSRSDRIQNMVSGHRVWDDLSHSYRPNGFTDMAQAINYVTSHDVAGRTEQRLLNFYLSEILRYNGMNPGPNQTDTDFIKGLVDNIATQPPNVQAAHAQSLQRIGSTFAVMLTSVGVPMFLAGEEFADIHDVDHSDPGLKQEDPVDWSRRDYLGHQTLFDQVQELIALRTQHPALQRNEVEFFYFHPTIDDNDGVRVFAYCRNGGRPLGSNGQVVVVANTGGQNFPQFDLPWKWTNVRQIREHGVSSGALNPQLSGNTVTLSLAPFQVRVFST